MNSVTSWGYHLIVDIADCNHDAITSYDTIYKFVKELVKDIDMIAYGEPQIVKFGSGDKIGYTLVQLIETSNICAHFVDEDNTGYIDVFSCKPFDQKVVQDLIIKHFGAQHLRCMFLHRQAGSDET